MRHTLTLTLVALTLLAPTPAAAARQKQSSKEQEEKNARLLEAARLGQTAEVRAALDAGAPRILLDNMDTGELRAAVELTGSRAELEASGGVSLETARAIAETGVDFVSVGALTHSAPALDISLILEHL